jgi:PAS domain S-box-containing protein
MRTSSQPIFVEDRVVGVQGVLIDITERKRAEEALRLNDFALERTSDAVYWINAADIVDVNESACRMLGYSREEFRGMSVTDIDPVMPEAEVLGIWENLKKVGTQTFETQHKAKDGRIVPVEIMVNFIDFEGKEFSCCFVRDITERKQAEEALRESEERFRTIFDYAPIGINLLDPERRPIQSNRVFQDMLGYTEAELSSMTFADYTHPDDMEASLRLAEELLEGQSPYGQFEKRYYRKDGELVWVDLAASAVSNPDGELQYFIAMVENITERKQAAEALQQYTERLKVLREIDQAILAAERPQSIAQAGLQHVRRLVPALRGSVTMFDFEAEEVTVIAADVNGATRLESGKRIPMDAYTITEEFKAGREHMVEDIQSIPEPVLTDQALLAEGIRSYVNVPLLSQGELIGSLNFGSDRPGAFGAEQIEIAREVGDQLAVAIQQARLHEQVQRHADELEQRVAERTADLEAAYKELEALSRVKDEFVTNVSHELRTPITTMRVHYGLLELDPDTLGKSLPVMRRETERLSGIIEDLLRLSRLDQDRVALELAPVDLNALASQYVADRQPLAEGKGLVLTFAGEEDLPSVQADEGLLGQVLSILLTNALNYTPSGGSVVISTRSREEDGQRWASFSVGDTGRGIPPEEQSQAFERFFRGKVGLASGAPGTGLGLALAREIVERHRGQIELVSEGIPGKGATFTVWLPVEGATHG